MSLFCKRHTSLYKRHTVSFAKEPFDTQSLLQKSPLTHSLFAKEPFDTQSLLQKSPLTHSLFCKRALCCRGLGKSFQECVALFQKRTHRLWRQLIVGCGMLLCDAVCCSVLQCVCCSVLQCVAACCSVSQCVAVCCSA